MENTDFYIIKYAFTEDNSVPDLPEISPLVRRRMMIADKMSLYTMLNTFEDNAEEIIFSSQCGEMARLDKIIEQYKTFSEASPANFSASVHNYIAGWFTQYKKLNIPYYALSAGKNSVSAALVKALISEKNNTMITCTDKKSVSVMLSKKDGNDKIEFVPTIKTDSADDEYDRFISFLTGERNKFETPLGLFKRCKK